MSQRVLLMAGVPQANPTLFHRIQFLVGDSAALIETQQDGQTESLLFIRDIEVARARQHARADRVVCSADFPPAGGLSGDRDTALAQAVAEYLKRQGIESVVTDRTLPFLYAHHVMAAGIRLEFDDTLGVLDRRVKSEQEIESLLKAQQVTMQTMKMACETICQADADAQGVLHVGGEVLTSERLRTMITTDLLQRGFSNSHGSIVATNPHTADCHHSGTGPLRTGLPVIVDIFPMDDATRYWGDCTRTAVHGEPSAEVIKMHAAVMAAKQAGTEALRPGVTGADVHQAVVAQIEAHGFQMRRGADEAGATQEEPAMRHGTGHGIGLDVHEPILLDDGAGEILAGEVFTVEPGLYSSTFGGVRVEDMVAVTPDGSKQLGDLHTGLDW